MSKITTRDKSKKQEEFLAKQLNARRTPNSGATFHTKGDLQDEISIFEAKTSMKPKISYTVKKEDLKRLEDERFVSMKEFGFLVFDFGEPKPEETYVVMTLDDFNKLYRVYKEEE